MTRFNPTWLVSSATVVAIALLLGVPFLLRPAKARLDNPLLLVIVSPHDEGVKVEFERAFSDWHQARFGRPVKIDWPNMGGTGDINRYVASQFAPKLRKAWGGTPPENINWVAVDRPATAPDDEVTRKARKMLKNIGVDIDIFFGGGDYPHQQFKRNGWSVPADLPAESDYFKVVPPDLNGLPLYDKDRYWLGAVLTRVGIIANKVVCDQLHLPVPHAWADLADPRFRNQLALGDPNFSGAAKLCYEMVLQKYGWAGGWPTLTRIAANARYFGISSTQTALDVSRCEAAAGMIIDYYGRTQVAYLGDDRLEYTSPAGGTATTPDPISIMRGAPHREVARRFVEFVLSAEGQKLWMGKVGSPGGPRQFALCRPPIRPDVYRTFGQYMIVQEDPFTEPDQLRMDARVQGKRFGFLGVAMRAAFIDNADLLIRAADYAQAAEADSPARRQFDALPFPESNADKPEPGSMWGWVARYNKARDLEKEAIADELSQLFRMKYEAVLAAERKSR